MNASPICHLRLFGSPSLEGPDGTPFVGRAAQRHPLALLALLAAAPGQRLRRDKLIAYLWPESDPDRGRNLLKVATYNLRKALGESALLSAADDLRLNPTVIETDVIEFEAALEARDYARAATLYRGAFLDGLFLTDAPEFERWWSRNARSWRLHITKRSRPWRKPPRPRASSRPRWSGGRPERHTTHPIPVSRCGSCRCWRRVVIAPERSSTRTRTYAFSRRSSVSRQLQGSWSSRSS